MTSLAKFLKVKDLDLCTDQEILASWDRMATRLGTMPASKFQEWQQATGISCSPPALLASSSLKEMNLVLPVTMYTFDWMHTLCSAGVLNYTFFAVLQSLEKAGMEIWISLQQFMQFFGTCPRH